MQNEALLVILGWPLDGAARAEIERGLEGPLPFYGDGAVTCCEACGQGIAIGRRQHHVMRTCTERRVLCVSCYVRGVQEGAFTCTSVVRLDEGTGRKPS